MALTCMFYLTGEIDYVIFLIYLTLNYKVHNDLRDFQESDHISRDACDTNDSYLSIIRDANYDFKYLLDVVLSFVFFQCGVRCLPKSEH